MNITEREVTDMAFSLLTIAGGFLIGLGISTGDMKKCLFGAGIGMAILFVRNL